MSVLLNLSSVFFRKILAYAKFFHKAFDFRLWINRCRLRKQYCRRTDFLKVFQEKQKINFSEHVSYRYAVARLTPMLSQKLKR